MAARSDATRPAASRGWLIAKVSSPGDGANRASLMLRPPGALDTRVPAFRLRAWSSKPSGSTEWISVPGDSASKARDTPAISPPPETGQSTISAWTPSSASWRAASSPTVPWPAMTWKSSKAGTTMAPRSPAMRSEMASRDSV